MQAASSQRDANQATLRGFLQAPQEEGAPTSTSCWQQPGKGSDEDRARQEGKSRRGQILTICAARLLQANGSKTEELAAGGLGSGFWIRQPRTACR